MISTKKKSYIVELRPHSIRAIRTSSDSAPTVIEDLAEFPLDNAEEAAAKVREFAGVKSSAYLHGDCTIFPSNRVVRHLQIEASKGKEATFVLDYLKNNVGVSPDDYAAFCLAADTGCEMDLVGSNKKTILLCGAPRAEIVEAQKDLVKLGVYPGRLEIGTVSTIGVLVDMLKGQENASPILFLEIDDEFTNAVIVGPKGAEMARKIECGSRQIASALKDEMNLKDEAAAEKILSSRDFDLGPIAAKIMRKLLRELQSSIGFFEVQTGYSVSRLYCLKQGSSLGWLQASVSDLLNLRPVEFSVPDWLARNEIGFEDQELASRLDLTWIGMLGRLWELGEGKAES